MWLLYFSIKLLVWFKSSTNFLWMMIEEWSVYQGILFDKARKKALSSFNFRFFTVQAPVVRRLDNAICWINLYPVDSIVCFSIIYPLIRWITLSDLYTTGPSCLVQCGRFELLFMKFPAISTSGEKSIVAMLHLSWNLARNVKVTERKLFEHIRWVFAKIVFLFPSFSVDC